MKSCFSCLRRIRFLLRPNKSPKKWLTYMESYCSQHSRAQWCELMLQNIPQIQHYTNASQQTLRQLRSTNISSEVIKVMRRDYERRQTPFTLLVDIFVSYVVHKYEDANIGGNGNVNVGVTGGNQTVLGRVNGDVENFVDFMRSLMVIYYQLEERQLIGDDQFFRVTLSNFITECLFLREELYNCVIQVTKIACKEAQDRIAFNMQKFGNLEIGDYEVNAKYTLNEATLKFFGVEGGKMVGQKPYIGPIKIVKQIIKARTPIQKTKNIENLLSQIQFSLHKFYQTHNIPCPITLDADNAISILLYILVQSQQSQLLTHLNIVYNFLNKESVEGKLRFCLDMVKACLELLEKGSVKRSRGMAVEEKEFSLWINTKNYFQYTSNR